METALFIGLATGLTSSVHCAGMCGPLAGCVGQAGKSKGILQYFLARLLGYVVVGYLVGSGVHALRTGFPEFLSTAVSWGIALFSLAIAIRLWFRKKGTGLVSLGKKPSRLVRFGKRPFLLGAGTVLLPCGALWGAVALAATYGTPMSGGLFMFGFAAASSLGLLGISFAVLTGVKLSSRTADRVMAMLLVVGSIVLIARPFHAHGEGCHHGSRYSQLMEASHAG